MKIGPLCGQIRDTEGNVLLDVTKEFAVADKLKGAFSWKCIHWEEYRGRVLCVRPLEHAPDCECGTLG